MLVFVRLARVKHWLKNMLIIIPVVFAGSLLQESYWKILIPSFFAFSFLASFVYIINDIKDLENDRKHAIKKARPLASGAVAVWRAVILAIAFVIATVIFHILGGASLYGALVLLLYAGLNIAYSFGLKNVPILDLVILSSGFILRILYGSAITGIMVSNWLYLVVVAGSLYMSMGKRRNELLTGMQTRKVLKHYNYSFLDKNMYVCFGLAIVFYSLWCLDIASSALWSVPWLIITGMRYSMNIEAAESSGDPVDVIMGDKILLVLGLIYVVAMFFTLYYKQSLESIL